MLRLFQSDSINDQLRRMKRAVLIAKQAQPNIEDDDETTVGEFVGAFHADERQSADFAVKVSKLWPAVERRTKVTELSLLTLAQARRTLMLSSAASWHWLGPECAVRARSIVQALAREPTDDSNRPRDGSEEADWLRSLVQDTLLIVRSKKGGTLHAQSYFPASSASPSFAPRSSSFKISSIRGTIIQLEEHVCWEVIPALHQWLDFPHQTDLLGAQFVMHLVQASGNLDVLLLDSVWNTFRAIKTRLLREGRSRHTSLSLDMLTPFLNALASTDLALEGSDVRDLMNSFSQAVAACSVKPPCDIAALSGCIHPANYPLFLPVHASLPRTVRSCTKPRVAASDSLEGTAGHKTLLSLVRQFIPLVQHGIPIAL